MHTWDTTSNSSRKLEQIRVFHDNGYTEASVFKFVGSFWVKIADTWGYLAFMIVGFLPLLITAIGVSITSGNADKMIVQNSEDAENGELEDSVDDETEAS